MKEYLKPMIAEMGEANHFIQGSKVGQGDAADQQLQIRQNELAED
jgi:hypothetical protein